MIAPADLDALKGQLFCQDGATVFAIVDGAAIPNLTASLHVHGPEHACLLRGTLEPDLAEVAPYLVALKPGAPFSEWLLHCGWGMSWGIFGVSGQDLHTLHRYFRRCVRVDHAGTSAYFRYYDPTVLRNYLPTCTAAELRAFFGPVSWFLLEDEEPDNVLLFSQCQNELQQRAVPLRDLRSAGMAGEFAMGIATEPSAARLTLRAEQLKQLGRSIYVERMRHYLHSIFPETEKMPRKRLGKLIEELTDRAAGYKLVLETHVAPFIVAALILGLTFDDEYPLAQEVLLDYEMDSDRKAQWLWDFVEVTAGERAEQL